MTTNKCVHHYILPPYGLVVTGVCKKCGAEETWDNTENNGYNYWHEVRKNTWQIKLDNIKENVL